MLIAELTRPLYKFNIGRHHPALALYRLHHNGARFLRNSRLQCGDIVEGQMAYPLQAWPETVAVFGLPPYTDGKQGTSVEAIIKRNDLKFFRPKIVMRVPPCQF